MTEGESSFPPADAWIAAVHSSEEDFQPLGTAFVIDTTRLLTCAHVVISGDGVVRDPLWIAFPKAEEVPRRRVALVTHAYSPPVRDVAVLVLEEPVPDGVGAAPLRCPRPADLVNRAWWAFGFPNRDPIGNSADGLVGTSLGYGWIRLDTNSRYLVEPGFSGGALWSRDYAAVVGIVGQAHGNGDGRAITLHQADLNFPGQKLALLAGWSLAAAGEVALQQWGWTLALDPEGIRHWQPRARGVSIDSERGYRFRGRTTALNRIVAWLDRSQPDGRVLVITGSPGVGKSAVLGRIITTADSAFLASLPADDQAVRATTGSVSCAVHAKGKTALEIAEEIARAASARLPEREEDLAAAVRAVLIDSADGRHFNLIIDALDEAASPNETRRIIDKIMLPVAETCSDVGARVLVGTRRNDDGGELLGRFRNVSTVIDLDDPEYFDADDLAAYALACLQLAGDERPGSPYADDGIAARLARRIASMSGRNFLVAGLIARTHGLYDTAPTDPGEVAFPTTVDSALAAYLQRLSPVTGVSATRALTALAFAEAPGLTADLWRVAAGAIESATISSDDLVQFARSSAANFLIETGGAAELAGGISAAPVYRLFHQALNDALLSARSTIRAQSEDERMLTLAFVKRGQQSNWENCPPYLLRSLPGHAELGGLVGTLLMDDAYLLHADLRRLVPIADQADTAQARLRARLLRLTPEALTASQEDRAALFSVTEVLENLGASYRDGNWRAPYRARWASVTSRSEYLTLDGHRGWVSGVCRLAIDGQELLASAGRDGTVRVWDPQTGEQRSILEGAGGRVYGVCPVTMDGQQLLASANGDGKVLIWDPLNGDQRAVLEGHPSAITAVCPVAVEGQQLLASAGADGTVRIWDPQNSPQRAILRGHTGRINSVCPVMVAGQELLASAGADGTVRIWDPRNSQQRAVLEQPAVLQGHPSPISAVCPITVDGHQLLASADGDGTVWIWDLQTGKHRAIVRRRRRKIYGVCPIRVAGRELLASASRDGRVRILDPATGEQHAVLRGHRGRVNAVSPVVVAGQPLVASAGRDGTVRIWGPATNDELAILEGHQSAVNGICRVVVAGQEFVASASSDRTVRVWDPQTAEQRYVLEGHQGRVNAVCPITIAGQELLASGSDDETVRIWDPSSGDHDASVRGHQGWVWELCGLTQSNRELLVSAGADGTMRIWDPATGEQHAVLADLDGGIHGVCPVMVNGQQVLASGSIDGTVRIWDQRAGEQLALIEGHQGVVTAVCPVVVGGRQFLASAGADGTVRIWDSMGGEQIVVLEGHEGRVLGICPVTVDGREFLASAGRDGTVRIWNPKTGKQHAVLEGHQDRVNKVCPVTVDGQEFLASAGRDRTVRIWNPKTGKQHAVFEGHQGTVTGVCPVSLGGEQFLASVSSDRTARIWEARSGLSALVIPTHEVAVSVAWVEESLVIGLASGILAIKPKGAALTGVP